MVYVLFGIERGQVDHISEPLLYLADFFIGLYFGKYELFPSCMDRFLVNMTRYIPVSSKLWTHRYYFVTGVRSSAFSYRLANCGKSLSHVVLNLINEVLVPWVHSTP